MRISLSNPLNWESHSSLSRFSFPEETVVAENKRINDKRTGLKAQKVELEAKIKTSREAAISAPKLGSCIELIRKKLSSLDFGTKRQALDMLDVKVWLDGHNMEITGVLPIADDVNVTTRPWLCSHNIPLLPFCVTVKT